MSRRFGVTQQGDKTGIMHNHQPAKSAIKTRIRVRNADSLPNESRFISLNRQIGAVPCAYSSLLSQRMLA